MSFRRSQRAGETAERIMPCIGRMGRRIARQVKKKAAAAVMDLRSITPRPTGD